MPLPDRSRQEHVVAGGLSAQVVRGAVEADEAAVEGDGSGTNWRRPADGGYDLARAGDGTKLTVFNVLEGRGIGVLIAPLALRSARKGADAFAQAIKAAIEAS